MNVTLKNKFHNTEVVVRSATADPAQTWINIQMAVYAVNHPTNAAKARLRRVEKALCGLSDCCCGTVRG